MIDPVPRIVCIGGATIDLKFRPHRPLRPGTSNPASSRRSFGGVARNVAETLALLAVPTSLIAAIGDDADGRAMLRHLQVAGVGTSRMTTVPDAATAHYVAVLDDKNGLAFGLADMDVLESLTIADIDRAWPLLVDADWVLADCNLPSRVLSHLIDRRRGARFRLAIDAVSQPKATRLPDNLRGIDLLFLNQGEAAALLAQPLDPDPDPDPVLDRPHAARLLSHGAASVVLTRGEAGLLLAEPHRIRVLPGLPAQPVDVTGAGDALIAGTLWQLLAGAELAEACRLGQLAALLTIESENSVNPAMSPGLLERSMGRLPPVP